MPRLEVLELNNEGHVNFFSEESSATLDVCCDCEMDWGESEWAEDENGGVREKVRRATGQDPPENFLLGIGCEHPSYDEMDYTCAFCGKALTQEEDG